MKKVKIFLLLACGFLYVSCNDATDIVQEGELNDAATFQTVDDMESYLSSVYAAVSTSSEIGFTSIFTDEVGVGSANAGQSLDLYKFFLTNNDGNSATIWLNHYFAINQANRLIRGSHLVTPSADDLARYNSVLAQAKVIRAFCHLELMSYYAEDMKNDASLGVILMDRVPAVSEELPRNTSGEVFALIESDLNDAQADLVDHIGVSAYFYATQNLINAIRARMYAYRGNYTLAEQYADAAIAAGPALTPAGTYSNNSNFYNATSTLSPYRKMWADQTQGEIIWGLSRVAPNDEAIAGIWTTNASRINGSPYFEMGRNIYNLLADQNGDGVITSAVAQYPVQGDHDVRARAFLDQTSVPAPTPAAVVIWKTGDPLIIDKYPGKPTNGPLTNDLKVFRTSEMYLIKAEARAAAGDLPGVAAIIKQIRDVRTFSYPGDGTHPAQPALPQPLPNYADATAAWADILLERRKELWLEGHRYIDLRRLGPLAGGLSIDRYYRDCDDNAVPVCTLDLSDHRFVMPIPIPEIVGNANIQQNPGY